MTLAATPHAAIQAYIDGYLGQDAVLLRRTFDDAARMQSRGEAGIDSAPTAAWFERIEAKRRAGGGVLQARSDILSVDQAGPVAVGKVRIDFGTHVFTDFLSLIEGPAGWSIVHKIYRME